MTKITVDWKGVTLEPHWYAPDDVKTKVDRFGKRGAIGCIRPEMVIMCQGTLYSIDLWRTLHST